MSHKVVVHNTITLIPGAQNSVLVTTEAKCLFVIETLKQLFSKHTCLVATVVHQVKSETPFRVMIANFGTAPVKLMHGQNVSNIDEHPTNLVESDISHGELLGIVSDDTQYKKLNILSLIHISEPRDQRGSRMPSSA